MLLGVFDCRCCLRSHSLPEKNTMGICNAGLRCSNIPGNITKPSSLARTKKTSLYALVGIIQGPRTSLFFPLGGTVDKISFWSFYLLWLPFPDLQGLFSSQPKAQPIFCLIPFLLTQPTVFFAGHFFFVRTSSCPSPVTGMEASRGTS